MLVAGVIGLAACGGDSSDTPTTPTPPPIPSAQLQSTGQGAWSLCTYSGDCVFQASVQNTGSGCASGTTIVARLFDVNGQQVGADVGMGATGGLSARTIRPNEIVSLLSLTVVPSTVVNKTKTYQLHPSWNNVKCQ
jgi:hypothetical protein